MVILPLSRISGPCIVHAIGDKLFAVELWRNEVLMGSTLAARQEEDERDTLACDDDPH